MFNTLFLLSSIINPHQHSSNLCNTCINVTQEIKHDNSSLQHFFQELSTLCPYTNQTNCYQELNNTYSYIINHNSSDICENLGLCSSIKLGDYSCSSPDYKTGVFIHYNSLLGYSNPISQDINNFITFNQKWNLTFNETVYSSSFISSPTEQPFRNNAFPKNCMLSYNYVILKVVTENSVYYFNYTNDNPIYIGNVESFHDLSLPIEYTYVLKYNYKYNLSNNEAILDTYFNETHHNIILTNWSTPYYYKCHYDPAPTECCNSSILDVSHHAHRVSFH
jgi:hypothetical protein